MSARKPSLFLYGFEITPTNRFITFGNSAIDTRLATLNLGFYSLTGILLEIERALLAADPLNLYTATVDRTILGGLQNRVTISTSGIYLRLLFSSGNPSNPATLIGFNTADYSGLTTYTGSFTCGIVLVPNMEAYNYLSPKKNNKNFGKVNISASGVKEAITFSLQQFWQAQYKYIPDTLVDTTWNDLVFWMIQQRELEFTPDISDPNTVLVGTLDNPNNGLDFKFVEMLPDFPFNFTTPLMIFRVKNES